MWSCLASQHTVLHIGLTYPNSSVTSIALDVCGCVCVVISEGTITPARWDSGNVICARGMLTSLSPWWSEHFIWWPCVCVRDRHQQRDSQKARKKEQLEVNFSEPSRGDRTVVTCASVMISLSEWVVYCEHPCSGHSSGLTDSKRSTKKQQHISC